MEDNVLNESEMLWVKQREKTVVELANSEFSGTIEMDDRVQYERIAWKINGRSFPICWSCGGSIKQVGRLLRIKL